MQIISNIALITINETLVIQAISFLIFLFVINRVLFRPLRRTMDERKTYITNLQAEIEGSESEMETIAGQIKSQELSVRSEAVDLSKEVEGQGVQEADEMMSAVRKKVMLQINETQASITNQIAEAAKEVATESESLADRIMEKLLDRELL